MILRMVCGVILFVLMLPSLVVVFGSFTETGYASVALQHLGFQWYREFFANEQFVTSSVISFQVAILAAIFSCLIGTFIAVCAARYNFPGKPALEVFFTLPLMIPTIVLALAFLLFYTWLGISGGIPSLVVAHVVITTPYVVRLVKSSFANYNWNLERAAANLGASPANVFLKVTVPLILPGILGGALLSFIVSFDDAVVALFLSGPEAVTLPVRIFNYIDQSPGPIVAAAGSMLVFFSFFMMFLMEVTAGARAVFNVHGTKS